MDRRIFPALVIVILLLSGLAYLSSAQNKPDPSHEPAEQLPQAEELLSQRKSDDFLAALREILGRRKEDQATATMAQCRIRLYLGWIKECSPQRREQLLPIRLA